MFVKTTKTQHHAMKHQYVCITEIFDQILFYTRPLPWQLSTIRYSYGPFRRNINESHPVVLA